jgi:hypothetical protein
MNAQPRGGFEDDRGSVQPARAHETRTHADDQAFREAEIGEPLPGTIEDQQLLLEEQGCGDDRTGAAGTDQRGERRQQMKKKNRHIAHRLILTRS